MENLVKHLAPLERPVAVVPEIVTVGVVPHKLDRVRHVFDSFNFSFVLSGKGGYCWNGREYEVNAPMVLLQWPGGRMDYGPVGEWYEIFFIYPADTMAHWVRAGLNPAIAPFWASGLPGRVGELATRLIGLLRAEVLQSAAIDLIACEMIVASRTRPDERLGAPDALRLEPLRHQLQEEFAARPDYRKLARQAGMSLATLRRHWRQCGDAPPGRERARRQQAQACRLLVESSLAVKDIADLCGFGDQLYFSRRFRQWTGCTPTEYRQRNRPR